MRKAPLHDEKVRFSCRGYLANSKIFLVRIFVFLPLLVSLNPGGIGVFFRHLELLIINISKIKQNK